VTAGRDLTFWLGLPALRDNALWRMARRLQAPVLISANALSRWRTDSIGLRLWSGFETRWLHLVGGQRAMAMVGLDGLVRRA